MNEINFTDIANAVFDGGLAVGIVIAFARGWIVPGWIHKRLQQDHTDARKELSETRDRIEQRYIPILERATAAIAKVAVDE